MRTRLLIALLVQSQLLVVGFARPLLITSAGERTRSLTLSRQAALERFCLLAREPMDRARLVDEAAQYTQLYGEAVVVVDRLRRPMVESGWLRADDRRVTALVDAALRNEPGPRIPELRPWSRADVLIARPLGDGGTVIGAVVMSVSVRKAAAKVTRIWVEVLLAALAAAMAFALLAVILSRWVLRPLAELEDGIRAVGAGTRPAQVEGHGGPRELRALAATFNRMSEAVGQAADQQRRLISDASHQLRNPLAALRLRVDVLSESLQPSAGESYASVTREMDRLESVLNGLLTLASAENTAVRLAADGDEARRVAECRPMIVVLDRVDAWSAAAAHAEVDLATGALAEDAMVHCPEGDLGQILDVLIDNGIKYGAAHVTVSCHRAGAGIRIAVVDDGPGLAEEDRAQATTRFWRADRRQAPGSGLGLAIAHQLVTAWAGDLELSETAGGGLTVTVDLPAGDPA